jgi:hypothetical protein
MLKYLTSVEHEQHLHYGDYHPATYIAPASDRVWRPQIVAFVQPEKRSAYSPMSSIGFAESRLLSFISQLKTLSALCIVASIVSGEEDRASVDRTVTRRRLTSDISPHVLRRTAVAEMIDLRRKALQDKMNEENIDGFAKVFWVYTCNEHFWI